MRNGRNNHIVYNVYLRDRSCLLLCSLLLKALAQNWHLYFLSGWDPATGGFRAVGVDVADVAGATATLAAGISILSRVDDDIWPERSREEREVRCSYLLLSMALLVDLVA